MYVFRQVQMNTDRKIELKAKEAGIEPKEYVDKVAGEVNVSGI